MPADISAIVFGKGPVAIHAAERLLKQGADLRLVVPASTELTGQRTMADWAGEHGVPVSPTSDLDRIDDLDVDLGLSVFYDRLFRPRHISRFGRLLNVHNSLLPRHRGVRPINWALKEGDRVHGVSLHEITPGVDDGPVLDQESFPIDPETDEVADVYPRALDAAIHLLDRTLPRILELPAVPQDVSRVTTHHSRDDEKLGDRRYWRREDLEFRA